MFHKMNQIFIFRRFDELHWNLHRKQFRQILDIDWIVCCSLIFLKSTKLSLCSFWWQSNEKQRFPRTLIHPTLTQIREEFSHLISKCEKCQEICCCYCYSTVELDWSLKSKDWRIWRIFDVFLLLNSIHLIRRVHFQSIEHSMEHN